MEKYNEDMEREHDPLGKEIIHRAYGAGSASNELGIERGPKGSAPLWIGQPHGLSSRFHLKSYPLYPMASPEAPSRCQKGGVVEGKELYPAWERNPPRGRQGGANPIESS